jgi:DNA polymerase-3 subunit gamma/tau
MSYTALYRKWRPGEFDDVKGQEHIVTTLKNQLKADRIGHAYLFCGTRGTGKTTVAKLFAKAVNCEHPIDGSPCNECATCRAINAGTSLNVIEIDAASNNGVDNIREIKDEVAYSPTEGKYKVYIIDEVHMLSIGAFNALLKTLEEPPSYVIFILATTEVHKIPVTILSRCQRYDFKRISIDTISARLKELMVAEKIEVEEKAIRYIAKAADGSMRDALSLLDQCIAFYLGKKLTYDNVLEVLGAVDTAVFSRLLRFILNKDMISSIHLLEELIAQGRELGQFVVDFTWYMRNLLLVETSDDVEDVLDVSTDNLKLLKEEAQMVDIDTLMRYIRIFSELSNQIRYASQKRVMIELALIKLMKPAMEMNLDSVLNRLTDIENQLKSGMITVKQHRDNIPEKSVEKKSEPKELIKAMPEDVKEAVRHWGEIAASANGSVKQFLKGIKLNVGNGNQLQLVFDDELAMEYISKPVHKEELEKLIIEKIGKSIELQFRLVEDKQAFDDDITDIQSMIHMEIDIEEE